MCVLLSLRFVLQYLNVLAPQLSAGGAEACNPLSVTAFSTLLAAPGPCEQQDAADQMIALATKLNNDAEMIRLTKIFMQQPRNTVSTLFPPFLVFTQLNYRT